MVKLRTNKCTWCLLKLAGWETAAPRSISLAGTSTGAHQSVASPAPEPHRGTTEVELSQRNNLPMCNETW